MMSRYARVAAAVAVAAVVGLTVVLIRGDPPATERNAETIRGGGGSEPTAHAQEITGLETAPFADDGVRQAGDSDPRSVLMPIVGPLHITGRIVDADRRPVSDLDVRMSSGETGRSGPDGRFSLVVSRDGRGVRARIEADAGPRGSLASGVRVHRFDDIGVKDLGVLVLEPASALVVRVVACGEIVVGAVVRAEVGQVVRRGVTGPRGTATLTGLVNRTWPCRLRAWKAGVGNAYREVPLPRATEAPLQLDLDPVHDVTVQVFSEETGQPISGVTFEVLETVLGARDARSRCATPYLGALEPTGADGQLVLRGIPVGAALSLQPLAPSHHLPGSGFDVTVSAGVPSIRIELAPDPTCRWQVIPGEAPVPSPDADLRVIPAKARLHTDRPAKALHAFMDGTELVVTGLSRLASRALVAAPDDSLVAVGFRGGPWPRGPVAFQRPRSVEVIVHDTAGSPVIGLPVWIRPDGAGEVFPGAWLSPEITTDDGTLRFEGFDPSARLLVYFGASRPWERRPDEPAAAVDLGAGDARIEHTLEIGLEVIARVTVGGSPGLPADARISVHGASITPIEEDEAASTLRFRIHPPAASRRVRVRLRSGGRSVQETVRTDSAGPAIVHLDLPVWPEATVALVPPEDGLCRLRLQRNQESGRWRGAPWARSLEATAGGEGWLARFPALEPGTYRALDALSGAVSAPFTLTATASREPAVELDLSRAAWVEGRLIVPRPEDLAKAQVKAAPDQPSPLPLGTSVTGGIPIGADGSFRIRVPGDRPLALCAEHPLLIPEPGFERAIVTAPPQRAELRLTNSAQAVLRISTGMPEFDSPVLGTLEVQLIPEGLGGAPGKNQRVIVQEGAATFSGFEPGRYDILVMGAYFAPRLLEGVSLGPTRTDLGCIRLEAGGAVAVELIAPPTFRAGAYVLTAEHLEGVRYRRHQMMFGALRIELRGLLPGLHRVTLAPQRSSARQPPPPLLTQEVRITGTETVEIEHRLE